MSFSKLKSWDDRGRPVVIDPITKRSWTRRIQWLEDDGQIKLKLEDGDIYKEILTNQASANVIWQRFKEGQSIDDSISILGNKVPESLLSKRGSE